jgi:hypothetical protein
MRDDRRPFRDAQADIESARHAPDTPQARSPAYGSPLPTRISSPRMSFGPSACSWSF